MTLNARRLCLVGLFAILVLAAAALFLLPARTEANLPAPKCNYGDKQDVFYYSTPAKTTLVGELSYLCAGGTHLNGTATSYQTVVNCVCPPL